MNAKRNFIAFSIAMVIGAVGAASVGIMSSRPISGTIDLLPGSSLSQTSYPEQMSKKPKRP
jgi:hypothetical protein